uniref:Uncharacterized protein n=1 Tax=Candidatus Kentrum sp. FM TaxID=2126340 RepID=A0A450VL93_9GAMM|nr:MAG: hypothetical protein BECKFM1743A_GA0114220_1000124 [Candidatus Kentron sp. FM]VFJ43378.1 MAG: hypothetical protein BECKFM1743C_GA0114222_1000124 [Candidatus Kentron sp. FM]VFK05521.1 MAG: hypothetical protein BECKFM1743B_GA0114221_1000124 [Candidatus Kentron sp. FM]
MTRNYHPRDLFGQIPKKLLRRFFRKEGVLEELDWKDITQTNREPIQEAWLGLDEETRSRLERKFQEIDELAHEAGVKAILDEATSHGEDLSERFSKMKDHHERAFWTFLERERYWPKAIRLSQSDNKDSDKEERIGKPLSALERLQSQIDRINRPFPNSIRKLIELGSLGRVGFPLETWMDGYIDKVYPKLSALEGHALPTHPVIEASATLSRLQGSTPGRSEHSVIVQLPALPIYPPFDHFNAGNSKLLSNIRRVTFLFPPSVIQRDIRRILHDDLDLSLAEVESILEETLTPSDTMKCGGRKEYCSQHIRIKPECLKCQWASPELLIQSANPELLIAALSHLPTIPEPPEHIQSALQRLAHIIVPTPSQEYRPLASGNGFDRVSVPPEGVILRADAGENGTLFPSALQLDAGALTFDNRSSEGWMFAHFRINGNIQPEQPKPSFPGRPSLMASVKQEMRRRAERGELLSSLRKEAFFLEEWAKTNHPEQQTPTAKTIKNALHAFYRNLTECL